MLNYRLTAVCDEYGRFSFPKMKAGRYYLYTEATISGSYSGSEVVGQSTVTNGWGYGYTVDHTRPANYSWSKFLRAEKYIDITGAQPVHEVELKLKVRE